ncbi:MAG: Nif3-like dinuclear metal center hexameric protein [Helicobacter sp.]|nr:Nif3-like dinuclear metal center hexameric protein [Helicobacter sp.]
MSNRNNVGEFLTFLDSISPFSLQESWDNSGLILGSKEKYFTQIHLALEVDDKILEEAPKGALILTHHPLIFSPLKQLIEESYPFCLLKKAIQKDIQLISLHTNFDKTHFGAFVTQNLLGIYHFTQEGFVVNFKWEEDFQSLCLRCKKAFGLEILKVTQSPNPKCQNIALVTGSGAEFIRNLQGIDCLITGDIKYHQAMEAISRQIHLIDCGHYELEAAFGEILLPILTNQGYKAIISNSRNPFHFI